VFQITATGPDSYSGQIVHRTDGCTNEPANLQVTGSGGHYAGTIAFWDTSSSCGQFVGDGTINIDVALDGATAQVTAVSPTAGACTTCAPITWTRNGTPG
jgi:hypothetical protein